MKVCNIKVIFIILAFIRGSACFCQDDASLAEISDIAEELAEYDNDPDAAGLYLEYLNELADSPVKINNNDATELARLFFLSDFQQKTLAGYILKTGKILSLNEIAAIPGFDSHVARLMSPFISFSGDEPAGDSLSVKCTLITNMSVKPGEKDVSWPGSPLKVMTRFRLSAGKFSAGFTTEKDAGEKYFAGSPPLPDFFSAHVSYSGTKFVRKIIAGDYSLKLGSGTSINTGFHTGIQLTSGNLAPLGNNLRPFTSVDENNFFRGVAAELSAGNLGAIIFWSQNRIDAVPLFSEDSTLIAVSGLYTSGLHNTPTMLLRKDVLTERVYGINLSCSLRNFKAAALISQTGFSVPVSRADNDLLNTFLFNGKINNLCSINYSWLTGRVLLYGEGSLSSFRYPALLQGVSLRPSDRLTINFIIRYYSPQFTAFNGKAPGNSPSSSNEKGLSGNFTFEAAKHLFITAGCDLSEYPWLRYRISFPSSSQREIVKASYIPTDRLSMELMFDKKKSMINDQQLQGIPAAKSSVSNTFKFRMRYAASEKFSFTARIIATSVKPVKSKGSLILGDFHYSFKRIPLELWYRYCLFATDDWDSRIYTYENDLLYSFSIPALSGEGSRSYLIAKLDIGHSGEFRIKYAITGKSDDTVKNGIDDEVRLQLKFWF